MKRNILIGANASDIRAAGTYKLKNAESWEVNNVLAPAQPLTEISLNK